jgi:hypothetical protein
MAERPAASALQGTPEARHTPCKVVKARSATSEPRVLLAAIRARESEHHEARLASI